MLSIASGHSASYLLNEVGGAGPEYFTGAVAGGEPPGGWYGKGAEMLGLVGEVDAEVMHAVYDRLADPRDPSFVDPETRDQAARLGRAPKRFRSPEQVVAARVEAYSKTQGSTPTPEQVQAWTVEAERSQPKAVMFYDLTYSPPKSVSVLWAAYSRAASEYTAAGDTAGAARMQQAADAIEDGIASANRVMLDHVEAATLSRLGRHGGSTREGSTGRWTDVGGIVVASFPQHTNRDGDPQLHTHNGVLNEVPCPDGKWRAIDGKALYAVKPAASAIASMELRERLTRDLGVGWVMREDGNDFEIAGIEQQEMDLLSSRTRTMSAKADELIAAYEAHHNRGANAWERRCLRQEATLATRKGKDHAPETSAEMLDRADATMRAEVAGGLTRIAERSEAARAAAPQVSPEVWSPDAVIAQAIAACHGEGGRSTFTRHELARQIHLALPARLGLAEDGEGRALVDALTDHALASDDLVQTAGLEIGHVPDEHRLANGQANTIGPTAVRYAARGHVAAEHALLRATGVRGHHAVGREQVTAWLGDVAADNVRGQLSAMQREAVVGLASSNAAIAVLIGPAGTGKSYTVGRLADAWSDLTDGGRVVGVATAQVAADVLRDDGLAYSANTAAFLAAQKRLDAGRRLPGDDQWRLSGRDILVIDEASMVDTATLTRLQAVTQDAGARMVLLGDPRQLGAVGAGGMMRTVVEQSVEVYTLGEVRRFDAEWERAASLRLRDGDPDVVTEYDRRGRLIDGGTEAATVAKVARAAAADRLAGKDTVVATASNRLGAEVSAGVRRHLVRAGIVTDEGVILGRDGCTAGVGDVVQARRIDRGLGLTNRESYDVTGIREDGGLDVVSRRTGQQLVMPAGYVEADAALGYAGTVHAAEGGTFDVGHSVLTPGMAANAAYVAQTRGRESNTAWVVTDSALPDVPRATPRGVLASIVAGVDDTGEWSAHDVAAADDLRRSSAETLLGLIEDHTRIACRARLDAELDQLVADDLLSEAQRARFGAEQGSEHLARQLRALEQAGHNPAAVLREAITARDLDGALSVSQVVADRIDRAHGLPVPELSDSAVPEQITVPDAGYLAELHDLLGARRGQLGADLADAPELPGWLAASVGPVPEDAAQRAEWVERAGVLAAHREATGWDHPDLPLGRAPGVHTPEKRADWHAAYAAAGMPEERRPEAELTDGRLLARAAAADRIQAHAPAFVDDAMRTRHQDGDRAGREAVLARSTGHDQRAEQFDVDAAEHADAAARLAAVGEERGRYLAHHAETIGAGRMAREELIRRGHAPGSEPDRTTAAEWLAADRDARHADDAHRDITETDVLDPAQLDHDRTQSAGDQLDHQAEREPVAPKPLSATASAAEIAAAAAHAAHTAERLDDAISQDLEAAERQHDLHDDWEKRRIGMAAEPARHPAAGHSSGHDAPGIGR